MAVGKALPAFHFFLNQSPTLCLIPRREVGRISNTLLSCFSCFSCTKRNISHFYSITCQATVSCVLVTWSKEAIRTASFLVSHHFHHPVNHTVPCERFSFIYLLCSDSPKTLLQLNALPLVVTPLCYCYLFSDSATDDAILWPCCHFYGAFSLLTWGKLTSFHFFPFNWSKVVTYLFLPAGLTMMHCTCSMQLPQCTSFLPQG